jgi:glycosyltransferase involved in cell wall biosynthesis
VSVVLPVRNRPESVSAAVASVLAQSFDDLELVVVDDASTDETPEVVGAIADPRVRLVRLAQRVGAAAARNRGMDVARGRLIAFQDSDDQWREGHLDLLTAAMTSAPDAVVAYGALQLPPGSGVPTIPGPADGVRSGDLRSALARYNIVSLPCALVHASRITQIGGFDERLPRYQDWDLFLRLAELGAFCFVDRVVAVAGDAPLRISKDRSAQINALAMLLEKHRSVFARDPAVWTAHHARLLRLRAEARQPTEAMMAGLELAAHPVRVLRWAKARVVEGWSPIERNRRERPS